MTRIYDPRTENVIIYQSDFASGQYGGQSAKVQEQFPSTRPAIFVADPAGSGRKVLKLELHKGDPSPAIGGSSRSELAIVPALSTYYRDYTYRWSYYLDPETYGLYEVTSPNTCQDLFVQVHNSNDTSLGETSMSPSFSIIRQGTHLYATCRYDSNPLTVNNTPEHIYPNFDLGLVSNYLGQWLDIKFYVNWSYTISGYWALYINNTKMAELSGANAYNDVVGPYSKIGIYKWPWHDTPQDSDLSSLILHCRNHSVHYGDTRLIAP